MPEILNLVNPNRRDVPLHLERDFQGLPLIIEYLKGDEKPDKTNPEFGYLQLADYGYVEGTLSNEEGEGLDVFVCDDDPTSERVFLLSLMDKDDPQAFHEYKAILGLDSIDKARNFAERQYGGWGGVGPIIEIGLEDLIDWSSESQAMADKLERAGFGDGSEDEDDLPDRKSVV